VVERFSLRVVLHTGTGVTAAPRQCLAPLQNGLTVLSTTMCGATRKLSRSTPLVSFPSCLATHCNTLQHTATYCNILLKLQHTATYCNALQHTATHCIALQRTTTHCNALQRTATHCNTLQHTATHCNTLQRTATYNAILQHTATQCAERRAN